MPDLARLSFQRDGDVELAQVAGEVDASNVGDLSEELLETLSNDVRAVVLDLTNTSYIDSSGISLIFDAAARLRNRRQEFRLVVPPRSFVGEVLSAVSIEESVPIDPAVDDALAAVGSPD
ncbi:MAG TPA: STAS domain-containing protein [Solirubrobacterales bacterium]|nr:STAS domain-containing protein [Solirubrobacterales bacterium]